MKATIRIVCIFLTLSRLSLSLPIPETEPSYKSGPNGRGTIELLWSCLLTFGLCFWTVVHPNVIPWTGTWDQVKYRMGVMIGIIVMPEMLIFFALGQFLQAKKVLRSWESCFDGNEDVKKWLGKPGAFFVVMGGFVVDVRPPERHTIKELRTDPHLWHGRESSEQSELIDELLDTGLVKTIRPKGFRELLRKDWFQNLIETHTLPKADFCQKRIKDRGKADSIAKFLVTVQILWMCIQCLGRELSGLPITLLEGHILIQILFSAVAYGLWWHKPLDVAQPISLSLPLDKVLPLISPKKYFYHQPHFITEYVECGGFFHLFSRVMYDVANYHTHQLEAYAIFMGLVNGGLHAVAWTSHFPTATEHLLWQISCIGTGILLPMVFVVMWIGGSEPYIVRACLNMTTQRQNGGFGALAAELWRARGDWYNGEPICKDNGSSIVPGPDCLPRWARISLPTLFGIFMFAYLLSILYLTIESFLSIRSLSKGAYATVEWSDFIPHI